MVQRIIFLLFLFLALVLQVSFLPNFFPAGEVPNLILMMAIFFSVRIGFNKTWKWIVLAGLFLDFYYFLPVGTNAAVLILASAGVNFLAERFLTREARNEFIILAVLVLVGALVSNLSLAALLKILLNLRKVREPVLFFWDSRRLWEISYTLLVFVLSYWPIRKLENFLKFYNPKAELKVNV